MNVLILGSGGREHAFAWKLAQSPLLSRLFIAPGNSGTGLLGTNVPLSLSDFDSIRDFVIQEKIGLVLVGPEEPLVNGIADYFKANSDLSNVILIGPGREGARLEGSKDFAKMFMNLHSIPTAKHKTFTSHQINDAKSFLEELSPPFVLKADGLAAGKGVSIHFEKKQAEKELDDLLTDKKFGSASEKVVIEEFLNGIELSVFVLTDGKNYLMLPSAKDYKRIGEGDSGPNTGGMGAVSPVPFADEVFMQKVEINIVKPTIKGLQHDGIDYKGFIFIGLMNVNGNPHVIEYNVRMGDPETEAVLPLLKNDLLDLLIKTGKGELSNATIQRDARTAVTVVAVSSGYPGNYKKGIPIILGQDNLDSLVFHAGMAATDEKLLTNGGRVLAVTSYGINVDDAAQKSYQRLASIQFEGMYFRKDIGKDLQNADPT